MMIKEYNLFTETYAYGTSNELIRENEITKCNNIIKQSKNY